MKPSRPTKIITRRKACGAFPKKAKSFTRRKSNSISVRVLPSVAGPKRPQDRIELPKLKNEFITAFSKPVTENGFGMKAEELPRSVHVSAGGEIHPGGGSQQRVPNSQLPPSEREMAIEHPTPDPVHAKAARLDGNVRNGSVLIAAITSCTNTSNPSVMLAAGLLAKKAVEKGLTVNSTVKASLAPGSRVVSDYLDKTGLQPFLDKLGFNLVGYGCTTCIGNSGPLHPAIEEAVVKNNLVAASVLSGNRNFEARVHQNIKANFLMSPPLVVAFALAGRVDIDFANDALGTGKDGKPVHLRDIWPSLKEVRDLMQAALQPEVFRKLVQRFRRAKSEVERNFLQHRQRLRVGSQIHLHSRAAVLREFLDDARQHKAHYRCPRARHFWRQRDDRPHFARRLVQENVARRKISRRERRRRWKISTATARAAATTA